MEPGQVEGIDWLYFTSICALCRREDQPWGMLLDSLHVPFLLGRVVSIMLEADFQQDPIYKHLIAVVMATANLLSTACREAEQAGSSLLQMGTLMCHQLASSGMFERLPLVMGDITRALNGVSDGYALGHHSATLTLLGMPFLQLFTDLSSVWPGANGRCLVVNNNESDQHYTVLGHANVLHSWIMPCMLVSLVYQHTARWASATCDDYRT
jgi:hypothetical protein